MPYDQVMHKFASGSLHSGKKSGPVVHNRAQALAIMLSEKRAAEQGKEEYKPRVGSGHPLHSTKRKR